MTHRPISGKRHPGEMERVTAVSALAERSTRHGKIRPVRPRVVRIDIAGLTAARSRAQEAVLAVLDTKANEEFWRSFPVSRVYPGRPWSTWSTVNDPGLDYVVAPGRELWPRPTRRAGATKDIAVPYLPGT